MYVKVCYRPCRYSSAAAAAGVDFLCIDSSHGNSTHEKVQVEYLKAEYPEIDIIYGNVATAGGAIRGIEWGADAIRVGKGVGSICSTSQVSLGNRSQITATYSCARAVREYCREKGIEPAVPVISDGGYGTFSAIGKCLQSLAYRNLEELHEAVFSGKILLERMSEAGKKAAGIHDLVEYRRDLPLD
jgi:hypothetical protein